MKAHEKKIIIISSIVTISIMVITFLLNVLYNIFKFNSLEIFSFSHSFLPYLILLAFLTSFISLISIKSKEKGKEE